MPDTLTPPVECAAPAICSYNEWDPLEQIIVGRVTGAAVPPWHVSLQSAAPKDSWELLKLLSGKPVPAAVVAAAQKELDGLIHVLESEGVVVHRPEPIDQTPPFTTPDWTTESGYNIANPRDLMLVVGDEILETPGAWRSRYFEIHAYRKLLHAFFHAGARWTAAPKPQLADSFFDENYTLPEKGEQRYSINESDCTFDAADFMRCGRDIFCTRSNVTNQFGIEWLRRHLGETYTIHEIETQSRQPMHIDTTFVPLAPGKLLINPDYVDRKTLPSLLDGWEVREAPRPVGVGSTSPIDLSSAWLSMNVLMLDPQRVIVEAAQEPLIQMFEAWGFQPIPIPFANYFVYGGAFHCATLDIRRRGTLESYFD